MIPSSLFPLGLAGETHWGHSLGELQGNFSEQQTHINVWPCYSLCSCYYVVDFSPLISHGEIHLLGTACDPREGEAPASLVPHAEWFACGNLNDPMLAWCSRHPNNCTPGIPSSSLASPGNHSMFFFLPGVFAMLSLLSLAFLILSAARLLPKHRQEALLSL